MFPSVTSGDWEDLLACDVFVENKWGHGSKVLSAVTDMPVIVHPIGDSRRAWEERLEQDKIQNRETVRKICHCPGRNDECLNQTNDGRTFLPVSVTCWELPAFPVSITFAGFLGNQKL